MKLCSWALLMCVIFVHTATASTYTFRSANAQITVVDTTHMTAQQIRNLVCMARNIYHESRGESPRNQLAVAWVTRNRAHIKQRSICAVVFESRLVRGRKVGQFSWTVLSHTRLMERAAWRRAQTLAAQVLRAAPQDDITRGATHFHERHIRPAWSRAGVRHQTIGAHVFLRIPEYVTRHRDG